MNTEQGMSNDEVNSQNQNKRKFDLEERLIIFAILIMKVSENLHTTPAGRYISGQIVRSCTSPALHYGEAQSAESRADFVHKLQFLTRY
jgi:four helix bundle protein